MEGMLNNPFLAGQAVAMLIAAVGVIICITGLIRRNHPMKDWGSKVALAGAVVAVLSYLLK